jgi:hypothetical protein
LKRSWGFDRPESRGPIVVVDVFALANLLVEERDVVDHDTAQQGAELPTIGAVTPFHLAVKTRSSGIDVDVADALVEDVPMKILLELSTTVGLDPIDATGQVFTDVVDELNGRASVAPFKDLEDEKSNAVADGEVLAATLLGDAEQWCHERHVDLNPIARLGISLPCQRFA